MNIKQSIYDNPLSLDLSLSRLINLYNDHGVDRIVYKLLSPNDNSKNQPYMAGHITDLGFIPTGKITETTSTSRKTRNQKRKVKYRFDLNYSWLSPDGKSYPAPDAKLIYYPQYPEVRLSGFVTRSGFDMGGWMDPLKKGRSQGRILFFGITKSEKILAYLAVPNSRIAKEINDFPFVELTGVFKELTPERTSIVTTSKEILLQKLKQIHLKGWIEGQKLNKNGIPVKYRAQNGGGYTLEAELDIKPNGYAGPDFEGWEIKQFGVKRCHLINSKILTLMTPEPDGGYYTEQGVEAFIREYGYQNKNIQDRLDFTGRHFEGKECQKSGLTLVTHGYDKKGKVITDASGYIALLDHKGNPASLWTFSKILGHWKRKHAKAAYIPSMSRNEEGKYKSYMYCNNIRLFEGTSFTHLLHAFSESNVYYDPGIHLEHASTKPKTKCRSQFRIKSKLLGSLYSKQSDIDILSAKQNIMVASGT